MDALNPTGYGVVLVTVASQSEATAIATIFIEEKLAACINVFPVQSIYQWEGNIQQESEFQLIIKTNLAKFTELSSRRMSNSVPRIASNAVMVLSVQRSFILRV